MNVGINATKLSKINKKHHACTMTRMMFLVVFLYCHRRWREAKLAFERRREVA